MKKERKPTVIGDFFKLMKFGLLVFCCVMFLMAFYQRNAGYKFFKYDVLWVLTASMEDTIPAKSYVLVTTVDPDDIKVGDVITFKSRDPALSGALNTHRVVEIIGDNEEFVTKGDHEMAIEDKYHVFPEDVVSLYVRNMPVLTFVGRIFTSTPGFIVCISLMAAGVIFWFVKYIFKKPEDEEEQKPLEQEEMDRLVEEEIKRLEQANYLESLKQKPKGIVGEQKLYCVVRPRSRKKQTSESQAADQTKAQQTSESQADESQATENQTKAQQTTENQAADQTKAQQATENQNGEQALTNQIPLNDSNNTDLNPPASKLAQTADADSNEDLDDFDDLDDIEQLSHLFDDDQDADEAEQEPDNDQNADGAAR